MASLFQWFLLNRRCLACLSEHIHDTLQQLSQRIRCDAVLLRLCTTQTGKQRVFLPLKIMEDQDLMLRE